ncbi:MAG: hypothetical protein CVU71_05435 [Deltaproteobacteria bacterium HGW-Deltaproteobacteria-6]|nr:MAG: hypothetical protein CVU71_05435 [Deltaproteobacteria bacterium HGW-Deltaproteobacteria-6]
MIAFIIKNHLHRKNARRTNIEAKSGFGLIGIRKTFGGDDRAANMNGIGAVLRGFKRHNLPFIRHASRDQHPDKHSNQQPFIYCFIHGNNSFGFAFIRWHILTKTG